MYAPLLALSNLFFCPLWLSPLSFLITQVAEKTAEQEKTGRETVTRLATRLHHLRSTATCQGIYNSPYHVGYHPTAFGVPVEEHLRSAVRPVIKKELSMRGRSLKPVGSLPPIEPRNVHQAGYAEMEQEERQERWLSKTRRMAQEDFVTAAGKLPLNYPGSVHLETGYNPPPQSLERSVDKAKWISDQNFKPAVPTNRFVDPVGLDASMDATGVSAATKPKLMMSSIPAAY